MSRISANPGGISCGSKVCSLTIVVLFWGKLSKFCRIGTGKWWKSGGQVWALLAIWQVFVFSVLHPKKGRRRGLRTLRMKISPIVVAIYQSLKIIVVSEIFTSPEANCGGHWGHIFDPDDGAKRTGQRHCVSWSNVSCHVSNFFGMLQVPSGLKCEMGGGAMSCRKLLLKLWVFCLYSAWESYVQPEIKLNLSRFSWETPGFGFSYQRGCEIKFVLWNCWSLTDAA